MRLRIREEDGSIPGHRADSLAAGPRARCGDRNFLSLLVCMKRECEAPALAAHPECVKMREQEEAMQRPSR